MSLLSRRALLVAGISLMACAAEAQVFSSLPPLVKDNSASVMAARLRPYLIFGSSTREAKAVGYTTYDGQPVPPSWIGRSLAMSVTFNTLPNVLGVEPQVMNYAASGTTPTDISNKIISYISQGLINSNTDVAYYIGINGTLVELDEYNIARQDQINLSNAGAPHTVFVSTNKYGNNDNSSGTTTQANDRKSLRMARYIYDLNDPRHSFADYNRGHQLWNGSDGLFKLTPADIRTKAIGNAPDSFSYDGTHPTAPAYLQLAKYSDIPHVEAWGTGPCHFPYMPHWFPVSGVGVCGRLHFTGDLAGSEIIDVTPGFSIKKILGRPILYCSVLPTSGVVELEITVAKRGIIRTSVVPISIGLTGSAIPGVRYDGNHTHVNVAASLTLPTNAQEMSFVLIQAYEDYSGRNPLVPAGSSDNNIHQLCAAGATGISRAASGGLALTVPFNEGGSIAGTIGSATAIRRKIHGVHCMWGEISTVGQTARLWTSGGKFVDGSGTYLGTGDTPLSFGTPTLNSTFNLQSFMTYFYGSGFIGSTTPAANVRYFNGVAYRMVFLPGIFGFSSAARRAMFYDEANRIPVDTGSGAVDGFTPWIDIRGDAATRSNGAFLDDLPGDPRGGSNCKNFGSAGNLFNWFGRNGTSTLETLRGPPA